jgi:hypothetical protein
LRIAVLTICDGKSRKRWYLEFENPEIKTESKNFLTFFYSLPPYLIKMLTVETDIFLSQLCKEALEGMWKSLVFFRDSMPIKFKVFGCKIS